MTEYTPKPSYVRSIPGRGATEEAWMDFPCEIPRPVVFDIIWQEISKLVEVSDGKYRQDNFRALQTLTVWERVDYETPVSVFELEDNSNSSGRRKPKWVERKKSEEWLPVIHIVADKIAHPNTDATIVPTIQGINYEDLKVKLASYVASFTELLDFRGRLICPHCKGLGVIDG